MGPSRSARLRPLLLALLLATPLLAFPSPTPLSPLQLERRQFSGGIIGGILGTGSTTGTTTGTTTAATTTGVTTTAETTTEATTTATTAATTATTTSAPTTTTSNTRTSTTTSATSSAPTGSTLVIITSVITNPDGTTQTSTGVPAEQTGGNSSSSNTGKTWGIVGGVVGGIVVLAAILFIIWRCTQRRFSEIEDGRDEIKWPELQPDGQNVSAATSTLNPMGTRRTGGAGMEMGERGEREDREESQWGDGEMASQGNEYYDHHDPGYDQSGYGSGHGGSSYYDPYLGPSSAPHPPPQNIYPPPPRPYSPYFQTAGASNSSLNAYQAPPTISVQGPGGQFRSHSPAPDGMVGPLGGESRRGVTPPLPGAFL